MTQNSDIGQTATAQAEQALVAEAIEGTRLATRLRVVCAPLIMVFLAVAMLDSRSLLFVEACLAAYLVLGVLCCLTVRGVPLGRQCFKLAGIAPWPAGQRVISTDLATVPRQQAAVERFARARLRQSGRDADRAARRPSAVGEMERTDSPMKTNP